MRAEPGSRIRPIPNLSRRLGVILAPAPNVHLRVLRVQDISDRYVEGMNNPAVKSFLESAKTGKLTREGIRTMVLDTWNDSAAMLFGIFIDGDHCGNVRIYDVTSARAYIGVAMFDIGRQRRGYGTLAIAAVARYAVEDVGTSYVIAGIHRRNQASQKAFAKAGFRCVKDDPADENLFWHYP
jgi:RimJ/RimL family protein N-acetyltransferase